MWSAGPFTRMVQLFGEGTSSTKVYFSSPKVCSKTKPARPRTSVEFSSSTELTATPPQASTRRSMLRLLARLSARMPFFASASSDKGSIPFWLTRTKPPPLLPSMPQTLFLRSMIFWTRSSVVA